MAQFVLQIAIQDVNHLVVHLVLVSAQKNALVVLVHVVHLVKVLVADFVQRLVKSHVEALAIKIVLVDVEKIVKVDAKIYAQVGAVEVVDLLVLVRVWLHAPYNVLHLVLVLVGVIVQAPVTLTVQESAYLHVVLLVLWVAIVVVKDHVKLIAPKFV